MKRNLLVVFALLALLALPLMALPESCAICTSGSGVAYCEAVCTGPYPPGGGSYYQCLEHCCWTLCEPPRSPWGRMALAPPLRDLMR